MSQFRDLRRKYEAMLHTDAEFSAKVKMIDHTLRTLQEEEYRRAAGDTAYVIAAVLEDHMNRTLRQRLSAAWNRGMADCKLALSGIRPARDPYLQVGD